MRALEAEIFGSFRAERLALEGSCYERHILPRGPVLGRSWRTISKKNCSRGAIAYPRCEIVSAHQFGNRRMVDLPAYLFRHFLISRF